MGFQAVLLLCMFFKLFCFALLCFSVQKLGQECALSEGVKVMLSLFTVEK